MELAALVHEAETASRMERIEWRDRIAVHGAPAIEAVRPWLTDPALAAFAIRVIERAGEHGVADEAIEVLRMARTKVPTVVKHDVDWALKQLKERADVYPPAAIRIKRGTATSAQPQGLCLSTVSCRRARRGRAALGRP